MDYRLTLAGTDGTRAVALYNPHTSSLTWEHNGEPLQFAVAYKPVPFKDAPVVSPALPLGKSHNPRVLKIQLGLKCNYACTYCSQAHQPHDLQGSFDDVAEFLTNLPTWLHSPPDRIEFWGGEPFVYWKISLKRLAEALRESFPKAEFLIITNGSMFNDEIIEWIDRLDIGIGISHDGPNQKHRHPYDILKDPKQFAALKKLYDLRRPRGRISFNTVLHVENMSLVAVRNYIADKLGVKPEELSMSTEEIMLPYDVTGDKLSLKTETQKRTYLETVFWEAINDTDVIPSTSIHTIKEKIEEFFKSVLSARPAGSLGQKCGMDSPDNIAVDLLGNVMTCQNTSADTKHKIGSIEAFEDIKLTTAYHWSVRDECKTCPVLQLCKGACLFLEDDLWKQACDNSFTHNLAMLAAAMYFATHGMTLTEIEGPARRPGLPTRIRVIDRQ